MEFLKFSLSGFDDFLLYFGLSIGFLAAFLYIYMLVTPYNELQLIRSGNAAAAWSVGFAMLGFSLPLASAVIHSVNPWDMTRCCRCSRRCSCRPVSPIYLPLYCSSSHAASPGVTPRKRCSRTPRLYSIA